MNVKYFFFLFSLILFFNDQILCLSNNKDFNENRVLGGNATDPEMFKFVPSYRRIFHQFSEESNITTLSDSWFCSSTIISKRHLLTSAHCVTKSPEYVIDGKGNFIVAAFVLLDFRPKDEFIFDSNINQYVFPISKFGISSQVYVYDVRCPICSKKDLAIIEFSEHTKFNIDPVLLAKDYEERNGDIGIVAGYGEYISEENGKQIRKVPSDPRHAYIPIFDNCKFGPIICAGIANLTVSGGDSGGPLMIERNGNFYQIGITSAGGVKDKQGNAWFTPISNYCEWIENVTKNEVQCHSLSEVITTPQPSTTTTSQKSTMPPTTNKTTIEIYPQTPLSQIYDGTTTKGNNNATSMMKFNILVLFVFFFNVCFK